MKAKRIAATAFLVTWSWAASVHGWGVANGEPTVATNDASVGTVAWALGLPLPAMAGANNATVNYLKLTGFGLNIPSDAPILGITVGIKRAAAGAVADHSVRLVKGGVITGAEAAQPDNWPATATLREYGDSSALWGTTWMPAELNSPDFGVAISAEVTDAALLLVDQVEISVTYFDCFPTYLGIACAPASHTGTLAIDESKPGKEKITFKYKGQGLQSSASLFPGDVTSDSSGDLKVCIYRPSDGVLVGSLSLPRSGDQCDGDPCWSVKGTYPNDVKSVSYKDPLLSSDGIANFKLGPVASDRPVKISFKANNKSGTLPLGAAAALAGQTSVAVSIASLSSVGSSACQFAYFNNVSLSSGGRFKAKAGNVVLCGNGVLDPGEECDIGVGPCAQCDDACLCKECGNGVLDPGEECDIGVGPCSECDDSCVCNKCGNGILDPGEECDTGVGACPSSCPIVGSPPQPPCSCPPMCPTEGAGATAACTATTAMPWCNQACTNSALCVAECYPAVSQDCLNSSSNALCAAAINDAGIAAQCCP